jgi:tol-pal system protein YbgF
MKRIRNLAIAGCSVLLLCQCATQDDVRDLSNQIRAVNKKVEDVQNSTVDQIQKRQASSGNRIESIQTDFMQLRAMMEENVHQEQLASEKTKEDIAGFRAVIDKAMAENTQRLQLLEHRIDQLEGNLDKMAQVRIEEAEERAREAAQRAEEARRRTVVAAEVSGGAVKVSPEARKKKIDSSKTIEAAATQSTSESATVTTESAEPAESAVSAPAKTGGDLFDQGMTLFKNKQYTEAYKLFEQNLAQNPPSDQTADTLFYMGESLYAKGEYDLAILDYQKVISNHAKDKRTPTALLKQGMSFEKLTDHETAKIIYKKLISEYPDSAEAATAEQQLNQLQ